MIVDTDNYAEHDIVVGNFPGGELYSKVPEPLASRVHIWAKLRTWQDYGNYLVVADAYRRMGVKVHTFMPYLPGARQDRVQKGFPFSCQMYAEAIAGVTDTLTAVDVHSEAAERIYGDVNDLYVLDFEYAYEALRGRKYDIVLAADKGGVERAEKIAELLGVERVEYCTKIRESGTGALRGFQTPKLDDYDQSRILIPDDICDGGGTFMGIRTKINPRWSNNHVDLFVTHGIFSKGLEALATIPNQRPGFDNVFTTDSWTTLETREGFYVEELLPFYGGSLGPERTVRLDAPTEAK